MALETCKVWKEIDGHLIFTIFPTSKRRADETEEQTVERLTKRLKEVNKYLGTLEEYTMKRSDFPDHPDKEKWRIGDDNKIYVDNSIQTEKEIKQKIAQKAIDKLIALGLTAEEVVLLINDV